MNEGGVAVSILTRTVFFPELPTAYAGVDTTVNEGDTLILDGSGSSDPDGDIVTYLWSQMSGPSVTLSSDTAQSPTFVAPEKPCEKPLDSENSIEQALIKQLRCIILCY